MGSVERAEAFADELRRAVREIEAEIAPEVVRALASNALGDIVNLTPVDTGYARAGWIVTLDTPSGDAPAEGASDKNGAQAMKQGTSTIDRAPAFPHIFISNNVSYIEVLDDGRVEGGFQTEDSIFGEITSPTRRRRATGSKKSPRGMLTPTFEAMLESLQEEGPLE